MAISITWGTRVIYVPRADMPLLQVSPEIRELDLNVLRLALKDLEDDEEGMPFPDTHRHVTEATLSGLTFARLVEIINSYTVEFEDGQYTVFCTGANHNLADVKVANQVSLIINNSAGLIVLNTDDLVIQESGIKRGQAFGALPFSLVLTVDHISPALGVAPTGEYRLDGMSAWDALANPIDELGYGVYSLQGLEHYETDAESVSYRFSAAGCDPVVITVLPK